jgi:hypothetical protein
MALIAQSIGEEVGLLHARTFVSVHQRPFTGFNPLPRTFGHLAFSEIAILGIGQREQAERWNHTGHGHPIYQAVTAGPRRQPGCRHSCPLNGQAQGLRPPVGGRAGAALLCCPARHQP